MYLFEKQTSQDTVVVNSFSVWFDKLNVIKSSFWSLTQFLHCQELAHTQQTFSHRKDVDMTACTDAESLCKYSTEIKAESHPFVVHSCHLHHFVKPGLQHPSDIRSKPFPKLFSHVFLLCHIPSYCKNFSFAWDDVELCYLLHISTCQMFAGRLC